MTAALARHWELDPESVYLNHGSFGACPRAILEFQTSLRARLERRPMDFLLRDLEGELDLSRAALAGFVGCDAQDIAFVPNATTGVNAVLRSFPLVRGDELLVTDHAYNACRNALDFVAERAGAKVVVAHIPFPIEEPAQATTAVLDCVSERTRLALLDHITSMTGLVLPMADILAGLRARGVRSLVDGAHVPGHVPLDLRSLDPDYFTGNCHKWLCTPKGAAMLYVRRELQPEVRPVVISHGANACREDRSRFLLEFDWPGTYDPTPFLTIPRSLEYIGGLVDGGRPEVMRRNHALLIRGREVLLDALSVRAPAPEGMLGNLATVPLPGEAPTPTSTLPFAPIQHELSRRFNIEVPVFYWHGNPGQWLRISAQLYNDPEQYETLAKAVLELTG